MKKVLLLLAIVLGSVWALSALRPRNRETAVFGSVSSSGDERAPTPGVAAGFGTDYDALFDSPTLTRGARWSYHGSTVNIETQEYSPGSQTWDAWSNVQSVDFQLEAVVGRHANEIFVAGTLGTFSIISRWTLPATPNGAYMTTRTQETTLGVSVYPFTGRLA